MHADNFFRTFRSRSDFGDRQGRRVGSKDCISRAFFIEVLEDAAFNLFVFDSSFDNEFNVFHVFFGNFYDTGQTAHDFSFLIFRDFTFRNFSGQLFVDFFHAAIDEFLFDIVQNNIYTVFNKYLSNTGTHSACTNNHYFFEHLKLLLY